MNTNTRRRFLRSAGVVASAGVASSVCSRRVRATKTTLSGQFVAENGARIVNDKVNAVDHEFYRTRTDGYGRFEMELPSNNEYKLAFYKADDRSDLQGIKNGVPHVYVPGHFDVGDGPTDVGKITLPKAHILDFRIVDGADEPLYGSDPGYRVDGFGVNPSRVEVGADGYATIEGAEFTGLEVVGRTQLEFEPPSSSERYDRSFTVDEPTTVTATVVDEEVSWDVSTGARASNRTSREGETPSPTDEPTATGPPRGTPTRAEPSPTETPAWPTKTTRPTATGTPTGNASANRTGTPTTNQRGFLTNGADAEELGPLDDPFFLTVGGFALSVAGIVHNMVRGH